MRRRDRHATSRYDWPDDRKDFERWRRALGPCRERYWHFDEMRDLLTLRMDSGGGRAYCYNLPVRVLKCSQTGWRCIVARAAREMRHAIKQAVGRYAAACAL